MTIFLGSGFAAKYREGGGVLSVPLQWMLGLRRLKLDAIWLELLPATRDTRADQARIDNFQRQLSANPWAHNCRWKVSIQAWSARVSLVAGNNSHTIACSSEGRGSSV